MSPHILLHLCAESKSCECSTWVYEEFDRRIENCYWDQRLFTVHSVVLQRHTGEHHYSVSAGWNESAKRWIILHCILFFNMIWTSNSVLEICAADAMRYLYKKQFCVLTDIFHQGWEHRCGSPPIWIHLLLLCSDGSPHCVTVRCSFLWVLPGILEPFRS